MSTLNADLKRLNELKQKERKLKAQVSEATQARAEWERHCFDRMVREDQQPGESSTKIAGVSYIPTRTTYGIVQDRAAFLDWARENDEGLYQLTEREGLINQLVREKLDNGEPLPPGLGYYDKTYISVRGNKAKKEDYADRIEESNARKARANDD